MTTKTKTLIIVESPAKAKTIEKYLEGVYTVRASIGHIRDLPKSNKAAIDIPGGFIPHYEISPGKEKIVAEIKSLAKKADEVLLATDPDREGEAIAWHIKEAVGLKNPKRVRFHEITKDAIKEAIAHPTEIDDNLRKAQEARRVLDRLVGYDLSGLIWKKVRYGLSAGRVQSPALRIIMEREREIRAFKPEQFWVIEADTETKKRDKITLGCDKEPRDINEVQKILEIGNKETWIVKNVTETETKRSPKAPFTTSTLQQTASTRLGYAPSNTMRIAQKLYEAGLITYMRTDSTNLSVTALDQISATVNKKYGAGYAQRNTYATKSKNAQEAHEAIRPTDSSIEIAGLADDQKKLYRLIWQRTMASQMTDAKILRTKIVAQVSADKEVPTFSINGSRMLFNGWLRADPDARGEDVELPKVEINETLTLLDIRSQEKFTEPPGRYTEAGLIKELEKRGIGRPSTYASIMKTIEERGYVTKEGRTLLPTDTGDVVSTFLENNFAEYISDSFTAEMENKLDEIAEGKIKYEKVLKDFYGPFSKDVKSKEKIEKITNLGESEEKCPVCGGPMVIKLSKNGKFLSCAKFPKCVGARKADGSIMEGPKETGEKCPDCATGKLVEREGRFGKFISCNNYPKCKFIKKSPEEEAKAKTGVKCLVCSDGEIVERRGRFGPFFSCSNYPKCKFIMKSRPTGNICEDCKSLKMEGTKTIPERCSNVKCLNNRPDKIK
ncbi:MAG: type I DNA topoisomerase [bacterium]|nr:type I DNA topoisomerase [bacterium]